MPEEEVEIRGIEELPPPPDWLERLRMKIRVNFSWWFKPWFKTYPEKVEEKEAVDKLELLYKEMMADINASDVSGDVKKGLDPLPAIVMLLLSAAGGGGVAMILGSLLTPWLQAKMTYPLNKMAKPYRLPPDVVYRLLWKLYYGKQKLGELTEEERARIPPEFMTAEWTPEKLIEDLQDQGWSSDAVDRGLEASKVMPTPSDIIAFLAHEVFEPDMIKKYGLLSEWDVIDKEYAKRIGLDEETLKLYWINHWVHPALSSVYDMLHRDLIEPKDVDEYYRLVEIPEYWRDSLTELSWDVPNRIEIRMMTRYLDMPKTKVMKMLQYAGLKEEFRSDGADFMMVMGLQGYWSTMYRNGWLNAEGLLKEIEAKELEPVTAERVYKMIVKAEAPARIEEGRTLTRALIMKGYKLGFETDYVKGITKEQCVELLMVQQNYDKPEAEYIVDVEEAGWGSPETPLEFKRLVNAQRKAMGEEVKEIPQEVIDAERAVLSSTGRLGAAYAAGLAQDKIDLLEVEKAEAAAKYRELLLLHGP
ncbi:hypothetical protein ES708_20272 [subsurface metagenome]